MSAVLVAVAAAVGNSLQGWDNATIAGAVLYIREEYNLESAPTMEGLIVAMSLVGATLTTSCSGPISDRLGRRPMMIISSIFFFVSGAIMLWSPNVYVLLLGRLLDGFASGLAITLVPLYISETAPTETRGLLNTLPQFIGSCGMFVAYCMVFGMSLMEKPSWRLMLGILLVPSILYFVLTVFFLPESPRWLVSKGRVNEAKKVLQQLRGREDVSAEMALLVEGLGVDVYAGEDGNLRSPLICRQATSTDEAMVAPASRSMSSMKHSSLVQRSEASGITGVRKFAWHWTERERPDGRKEDSKVFIQEGDLRSKRGSLISLPEGDITGENEYIKAASLVSEPAPYSRELRAQQTIGPATIHPSKAAPKGPIWSELLKAGVRRALIVGVGIHILQQLSGINGVLYYTPQILEQAGVGDLLSHMGIGAASASLLISALTTLLMLPSIAVAMRLMDISGRRSLLLMTIPVLFISLIVLILGNVIKMKATVHAVISIISVVFYLCFFVMGFGTIPGILCAEIFPTRIRGVCFAICTLSYWIGDIIVTDTFPVTVKAVGLAGVFVFYAIITVIAWVFIFLKVPETKGMPLEAITEFFALGERTASGDKN